MHCNSAVQFVLICDHFKSSLQSIVNNIIVNLKGLINYPRKVWNTYVGLHKSRDLNAAVVWVPGCGHLTAGAVCKTVRAADLLQAAEGRRAVLEATCSRHCAVTELLLVRMEAVFRVVGALSWS